MLTQAEDGWWRYSDVVVNENGANGHILLYQGQINTNSFACRNPTYLKTCLCLIFCSGRPIVWRWEGISRCGRHNQKWTVKTHFAPSKNLSVASLFYLRGQFSGFLAHIRRLQCSHVRSWEVMFQRGDHLRISAVRPHLVVSKHHESHHYSTLQVKLLVTLSLFEVLQCFPDHGMVRNEFRT